jgi:hypothetical protein
LVGKYEGKRTLGNPRDRREDVNTAVNEIGVVYMDRIDRVQDWGKWQVFENTVMKFWAQQNAEEFLE